MERRAAIRHRRFKTATIGVGEGAIDCIVKNRSEAGAALEVARSLFIPDRFTLSVPSDQLKRRCHIVWRTKERIGVAFD